MKHINPDELKPWSAFEKEVAGVLILAGYEVERDVLLAGGQTDIIAIQKSSVIETRVLVECKYTEVNSSVSVDVVENFSARIQMLRNIDKIDSGFLVTNHKFSRFAKKAKTISYIQLLTLEQLRRSIFDFKPYLNDLIARQNAIEHPLIRPFCSQYKTSNIPKLHSDKNDFGDSRQKEIDLLMFLEDWEKPNKGKRLCILGDYGLGKSTTALWFSSILANKFLISPEDHPIPILIPLWKYSKSLDIQALVTHHIANECGITNFRYSAFIRLLEEGIFLLILDGFDEMARLVDEEVRYRIFADLSALVKEKSKIIVTGRPSFFPNQEELSRILSVEKDSTDIYMVARDALDELAHYEIVMLAPLNEIQVHEYIKCSTNNIELSDRMIEAIRSTYDLYELASRPVLLEMMVKSLPELLKRELPEIINAAKLYQVYTDKWVDREHNKGEFRKLIKKKDKLTFMQELAYQLFVEAKQTISHKGLGQPIKKFYEIDESDKLDHFSHDIRTCSFLQRNNNEYRFAHLSFQEYFAARKVFDDAENSKSSSWETKHFSPQIIRFISEILRSDSLALQKIISWGEEGVATICGENAIAVLAFGQIPLSRKLTEKLGMPSDVYQSYASFVLGGDSKANLFQNYLFQTIKDQVKLLKTKMPAMNEHLGLDIEADDVLQDTFLDISGTLKTHPLYMASELKRLIQDSVMSSYGHFERDQRSFLSIKQEIFSDIDRAEYIEDTTPTELDRIIKRERKNELLSTMRKLPQKYELVLTLRYYEELSITQIASELGVSSNVVRQMLKRAYDILRKELESSPEEN